MQRASMPMVVGLGCGGLVLSCCVFSMVMSAFGSFLRMMPHASTALSLALVAAAFEPLLPLLVAAALVALAPAPPRGQRAVSRADLGEEWPLTVEHGTLRCSGQRVTFEAPDGSVYAVNGSAAPVARDIAPIWAPSRDPVLRRAGGRVSIGPLIGLGLQLCGP